MRVPDTVFTIGHSTAPLPALVKSLHAAGARAVADVRRYPASRRHPQFDRAVLERELPAAGIAYASFLDLGGRRTARADSRNTAWRNASFRGYADYMQTPAFESALERLCEFARVPCALMCAESLWWRCHRALISDALKVRGARVLHIGSDGRLGEHPYTGAARIVDGELSYASGSEDLFARDA